MIGRVPQYRPGDRLNLLDDELSAMLTTIYGPTWHWEAGSEQPRDVVLVTPGGRRRPLGGVVCELMRLAAQRNNVRIQAERAKRRAAA